MNRYVIQCIALMAWNLYAPTFDACVQLDGTYGCPDEPSAEELRWWWIVTAFAGALAVLHQVRWMAQPWPDAKRKDVVEVKVPLLPGL